MPTKKKPTKKLKSVNVTGRKKVLLITLLAFVVVGAALLIRSFAASTDSVYTYGNGYLTPKGTTKPQAMTVDDGKSPQTVLIMSGPTVSAAIAGNDKSAILANTKFQLCVKASGVAANNVFITAWLNKDNGYTEVYPIGGPYGGATSITPQSNGFSLICSQTYQKPYNLKGPITFYNNSNSTLNLYSFTIRTITSDTPTPSK